MTPANSKQSNIRKFTSKTVHSHNHFESIHSVWSRFLRLFWMYSIKWLFIGTRIYMATFLFWILQLRILRSQTPFLRPSATYTLLVSHSFQIPNFERFNIEFFSSFVWYSFRSFVWTERKARIIKSPKLYTVIHTLCTMFRVFGWWTLNTTLFYPWHNQALTHTNAHENLL